MTIKTKENYIERLKKMKKNVYIGGEKVGHVDDRLLPGINVVGVTFDMAHNPEFEDVCTAKSHITGEKINRFCHIHQSKKICLKNKR